MDVNESLSEAGERSPFVEIAIGAFVVGIGVSIGADVGTLDELGNAGDAISGWVFFLACMLGGYILLSGVKLLFTQIRRARPSLSWLALLPGAGFLGFAWVMTDRALQGITVRGDVPWYWQAVCGLAAVVYTYMGFGVIGSVCYTESSEECRAARARLAIIRESAFDYGLEWPVFVLRVTSAVILGVLTTSWTSIAIGAFGVSVVINTAIFVNLSLMVKANKRWIPVVVIGSSLFDAIGVLLMGLAVHWVSGLSAGYHDAFFAMYGGCLAVTVLLVFNSGLNGTKTQLLQSLLLLVGIVALVAIAIIWGMKTGAVTLFACVVFSVGLKNTIWRTNSNRRLASAS